jgi:flagellum-specific ATP synthase
MVNIGAYIKGSNPEIDRAIEMAPYIRGFLRQPFDSKTTLQQSRQQLFDLNK